MGRVLAASAYEFRQELAERQAVVERQRADHPEIEIEPVVDIGHKAFGLLVHMALTALDTPSRGQRARLYWRGRDAQALALGYRRDQLQTAGARSNVSKAIKELEHARVIKSVGGRAFPGRVSTYELFLHGDVVSPDLLPLQTFDDALQDLFQRSTGVSTGLLVR